MAGEIEEPFRFNFQADTLHSGSISFGRFETEALCWERRSSFSHNRYLEEVEKCSKSGLVTAKKAYFEAHFRNRGLLRQSSSERQNATEYQSSENNEQHEQKEEGNCSPHFDQSSHGSSVHDIERESVSERGDFSTSFCEVHVEPSSDVSNNAHDVTECGKIEEENQAEFDELLKTSTELEIEVEQNVEEEGSCLDTRDMPNTATELHPDNCVAKEGIGGRPEKQRDRSEQYLKGRIASEVKQVKPRLTSRVTVPPERRNTINEASKGSATKPRVRVNDSNARSKAEKKSLSTVTQSNCSMHNMPKDEISRGSKTKVIPEIKSTKKELGNPKVSTSRPSSSHKSETTARQSSNRLTQGVTPSMRQSGYGNVDRRKEDHTKLDGKSRGKEMEIRKLQAKSQEKEKLQIKQLSKSLNFKATPMPSFYQRERQISDKSKGLSASDTRTRTPSSSSSKGTNRALSISKPLKSTDLPLISGATSCHSTVTTDSTPSSPGETSNNNHHPIKAAVKNTVAGTKKHINVSSHEVGGKKKPGNGRNTYTALGRSPRTGRVAVGVA